VTAEEDYPIQPQDIDASRHFFDAFDNMETEISAGWIIRFMQQRGTGWQPFTQDEIDVHYNRKFSGHFPFNRLVEAESVLARPAEEFGRVLEHVSICRNTNPTVAAISYAMEDHRPEKVEVGGGWVILRDGKYHVTHEFISRCHKSSPASPKQAG